MTATLRGFASREALAAQLASDVAAALTRVVKAQGSATLAVSGGTTPDLFFATLGRAAVDWQKITVTLVDERQVPETSTRSNARLVKSALLQGPAAAAHFVPLYRNEPAAAALTPDVVVLGMGTDGHTASFFPGGDTLATAIDPQTEQKIVALTAPAAGEPRLTFTLPVLLGAKALFLHIEGDAKRLTFEAAERDGPTADMPIRAVLRSGVPLQVYWCP